MCGLTGFFAPHGFRAEEASACLQRMQRAIQHRGPDDDGQWLDAAAGIALGHQRLSVIDLTDAGHQPMVSESGRYVLVFNGEIYNHLELRSRLAARRYRGHSDTETFLAAIEEWSLERTLQESVGMFAIAIWDKEERVLSLARDRMGEKPLYHGWQGKTFLFGSELKSLRQHPDFAGTIDRSALARYVRGGFVPTPRSIYAGIHKLSPGTTLRIQAKGSVGVTARARPYWSLSEVVTASTGARFRGAPAQAVTALERHLVTAIRQQQISDVPMGAFLSGGIDSSTVVALMQSISPVPVKTFTIGFEEQGYNEAKYAQAVAAHLGTDHTELYVTNNDALEVIPDLPCIYDEPFADASQIPTVLLSRLVRRHVTVALSGDGGDELFCGYGRYPEIVKTWGRLAMIPQPLRRAIHSLLPKSAFAEGLIAKNSDDFYRFVNSQWKGYPNLVLGIGPASTDLAVADALHDPKERMMYLDALNYLPDDILTKVDRAAMSASLETRVPLLNHHVVEFAWSLPNDIKYKNAIGKWPLKEILRKYVPDALINRPKMGFGVPIDHWLRGPLRAWGEELLSLDRLKRDGWFEPTPIRAHWSEHLTAKRARHYGLWTILMFQAWSSHLSPPPRATPIPRHV